MNNLKFIAWSKSTRDNYQRHRARINEYANTLNTGDGCANQSTQNFVAYTDENGNYVNRKLTITECERLMSWPDGWTRYGRKEDGTVYELSNTSRYKACGNGIVSAVPYAILNSLIEEDGIRVFSTFAGVDGSSMHLKEPKFVKVAFSEFDPETKEQQASNVLRYHYPNVPNLGDITKIPETSVPDHDLMFISAPCQTFSEAGRRAGFNETKGTLFYETARILKFKKPKYFLFENVRGILTHDGGNTFATILRTYSELGYEMDFNLFKANNFGIPHIRERVFVFGKLKE